MISLEESVTMSNWKIMTFQWLDQRDKDFEALQKTALEPQLPASFKYCFFQVNQSS